MNNAMKRGNGSNTLKPILNTKVLIFHLAVFFLLLFYAAQCRAFPGRVVEVREGDLMIVEVEGNKQPVRLYGVMCPVPGQPFHDHARRLSSQLFRGFSTPRAAR